MSNPRISVIIPLYNKEISIGKTIESVLSQSMTDFELVVVNDGSTDNSLEVVRSFHDDRIRIVNKENGGVSSARNEGIVQSNGEWIFFLDADDTIEPICLDTLYTLSKKYPQSDLCTSNFNTLYPMCVPKKFCKCDYETVFSNNYRSFKQQSFYLRTGIFCIKKTALTRAGYFNEGTQVFEDLELFTSFLKECSIAYTPQILFTYKKEDSDLSKVSSKHKEFFKIKLSNYIGDEKRLMMDILMEEILTGRKDKQFIHENWERNKDSILYILMYLIPSFMRCYKNSQITERLLIFLKAHMKIRHN